MILKIITNHNHHKNQCSIIFLKSCFLLIIFNFIFQTSFSQSDSAKKELHLYDKGKNFVGLGISGGYGARRIVASVSPTYARFLVKKFALGLNTYLQTNGVYYYYISAGPFLRYYFLNKRFTPFMEGIYSFSYSEQSNGVVKGSPLRQEIDFKLQTLSLGIGLSYIFKKRFSVESKIRYSYIVNEKIYTIRWYQSLIPSTGNWITLKPDSKEYIYQKKIWWDVLDLKYYF